MQWLKIVTTACVCVVSLPKKKKNFFFFFSETPTSSWVPFSANFSAPGRHDPYVSAMLCRQHNNNKLCYGYSKEPSH